MNELIREIAPDKKITSKGLSTAATLCNLLESQLLNLGITARDYELFHEFIWSTSARQLEYDTPQQHIHALIEEVRKWLIDALVLNQTLDPNKYQINIEQQVTVQTWLFRKILQIFSRK